MSFKKSQPEPFFLVLGLGKSGFSTAQWLKKIGASFIVWDDTLVQREKAYEEGMLLKDPLEEDFPWEKITDIIVSPGIPHLYPKPHPVLEAAQAWVKKNQNNIEVISDLELYIRFYPSHRYIAVTGTNGKSTTTALLGHLLMEAQIPVAIGANFGIPVFDLPVLPESGIYVFEVSSYQLETTPSLSPIVSILLNITPDHLERHGGWEGYQQAKAKVFASQALSPPSVVIGVDTEETRRIYQKLQQENRHPILYAVSVQQETGHFYKKEESLLEATNGKEHRLFSLQDLPTLKGTHNVQNAAAAYAALKSIGIKDEILIKGLKTFPGLAHRQEYVDKIQGIIFINDSKGTNVNATEKALEAYDNIYWILGGRSKDDNILDLKKYFAKVQKVFLIGESQEAFAKLLEGHLFYEKCTFLEKAVSEAFLKAQEDLKNNTKLRPCILLSPACASWDQFKSFEERGEKFKVYVQNLKLS